MTCLEGLPEQSLFSVKRTQQHSWVCKNASEQTTRFLDKVIWTFEAKVEMFSHIW